MSHSSHGCKENYGHARLFKLVRLTTILMLVEIDILQNYRYVWGILGIIQKSLLYDLL